MRERLVCAIKAHAPRHSLLGWGEWIFRRRTWLPLMLLPTLAAPLGVTSDISLNLEIGLPPLILGEALRIAAVGFAGTITRTRQGRLTPLVTVGPYRYVRNPLYIGNLLLFCGLLAVLGRWLWIPVLLPIAVGYYQLVVLWEEQLLRQVFGAEYELYAARVGRWIPRFSSCLRPSIHRFSLGVALRSERSTFGMLLLSGLVCFLYWTALT